MSPGERGVQTYTQFRCRLAERLVLSHAERRRRPRRRWRRKASPARGRLAALALRPAAWMMARLHASRHTVTSVAPRRRCIRRAGAGSGERVRRRPPRNVGRIDNGLVERGRCAFEPLAQAGVMVWAPPDPGRERAFGGPAARRSRLAQTGNWELGSPARHPAGGPGRSHGRPHHGRCDTRGHAPRGFPIFSAVSRAPSHADQTTSSG